MSQFYGNAGVEVLYPSHMMNPHQFSEPEWSAPPLVRSPTSSTSNEYPLTVLSSLYIPANSNSSQIMIRTSMTRHTQTLHQVDHRQSRFLITFPRT